MRMMQVLSELAATVMDKILTTSINLNYGEYGLLYALRRIQDFVHHTSSITSSGTLKCCILTETPVDKSGIEQRRVAATATFVAS